MSDAGRSRQPPVAVLVLNNNRRDACVACLASLQRSRYQSYQIILLDNGSDRPSLESIRRTAPAVRIIQLDANRGYAGNNNVGLRAALAQESEWILLLNEDTTVAPDCLERLIAAGEADPGIGVLGLMIYHADEPDVIQSAGGTLRAVDWQAVHAGAGEVDRGQFATVRPVDWVSGCAVLLRRSLIEQVGFFDERFFLYWEEVDLCLRARRQGWKVVHVPQAKVWHKGGQRRHRDRPAVTYYYTRNRLLCMAKHHAPIGAHLHAWGQTLRTLASWTIQPKWRHMRAHRDAMWHGATDFLLRRWGAPQHHEL